MFNQQNVWSLIMKWMEKAAFTSVYFISYILNSSLNLILKTLDFLETWCQLFGRQYAVI